MSPFFDCWQTARNGLTAEMAAEQLESMADDGKVVELHGDGEDKDDLYAAR